VLTGTMSQRGVGVDRYSAFPLPLNHGPVAGSGGRNEERGFRGNVTMELSALLAESVGGSMIVKFQWSSKGISRFRVHLLLLLRLVWRVSDEVRER